MLDLLFSPGTIAILVIGLVMLVIVIGLFRTDSAAEDAKIKRDADCAED